MSGLVSAEELEASVGDKFIGRHRLFELDLYNKDRLKVELLRLQEAYPDHRIWLRPGNVSEPEGFYICWIHHSVLRQLSI